MDQRTRLGCSRLYLERLLNEWEGGLEPLFVTPMNLTQNVTAIHAISDLLLEIKPDLLYNCIFEAIATSSQSIRSQYQKLSIASGHETARRRSKFLNIVRPWQQIGIVEDAFVAHLE